MTKPQVAIIILNWNGREDTLAALESLGKITTAYFSPQVYVVDNHSTDGSVESIKSKFPNVELIVNDANLGFSGGNNVGIKKALEKNADFVMLLNSDTVVTPNFIDELIKFINSHKDAGIVGPVLKFKKGFEIFYDLGGQLNFLIGRTTHRQVSLLSQELPREVSYLSGACLLIKKEVFDKIGLLNPDYFFGFEDVEFALEAKRHGFKIYIIPNSLIEHKISGSIGATSTLKIYYLLRNNLMFVSRQIPFPNTVFSYLYLLILSVKIVINSTRNLSAVKDAWGDFLRGKVGKKA